MKFVFNQMSIDGQVIDRCFANMMKIYKHNFVVGNINPRVKRIYDTRKSLFEIVMPDYERALEFINEQIDLRGLEEDKRFANDYIDAMIYYCAVNLWNDV